MASIRFGALVLGFIIVSLALKYSSACAQEGGERKGKWLPSIATQNHASSQNDLHEDISAAAVAKISGRKVLVGRKTRKGELLKREIGKKEGSNEKPEISGEDAPKKSTDGEHSHMNIKDNSEVSQEGRKEYASRNPGYSPNSTPLFDEHHDESAQKDDPKEFLEAADEVVNLMRKDYRGMDRPRRKPPINNHKPTD